MEEDDEKNEAGINAGNKDDIPPVWHHFLPAGKTDYGTHLGLRSIFRTVELTPLLLG